MPVVQMETLERALWPEDRPGQRRRLTCRHCGTPNRLKVSSAVLQPEKHRCGACGRHLFLPLDAPLAGIASSAYEHPLDKQALAMLKAVPGFPALVKWMVSNLGERTQRLHQMSSAIRCHQGQFPELVALLDKARNRLAVEPSPDLFLAEPPVMNAMTTGVDRGTILVQSATLDQLDDDELVGVFGHELGHLQADHVLYKTMARIMVQGSIAFGGYLRLLTMPLQKALMAWDRCSELTADRAALLATGRLEVSISIFLKMAGGNRPGVRRRTTLSLDAFIDQARELARMERENWWDNVLATLLTMDRSHPYVVWRLMHLIEWVERGNYLDILAGSYPRTGST